MKSTPFPLLSAIALVASLLLPLTAAETNPNADQLLRQMSAKLAAAQSFTFEARRELDPGLVEGINVPQKANIAVAVQRPNKLAARATSDLGVRRFIADGRNLTLLDAKANCYATVPMRTTLDGLVEQLDDKFGFTPPLAEFALSNPYKELRSHANTISYLGQTKTQAGFLGLFGDECYRIALKGQEADAELWIAVNDQLPRKLIATFHREGQPQLRITFSKWNLAATVSASDFAFSPPQGSQKIEMWTTARMQAARKR